MFLSCGFNTFILVSNLILSLWDLSYCLDWGRRREVYRISCPKGLLEAHEVSHTVDSFRHILKAYRLRALNNDDDADTLHILAYAMKHRHHGLCDEVAPRSVTKDLTEVKLILRE